MSTQGANSAHSEDPIRRLVLNIARDAQAAATLGITTVVGPETETETQGSVETRAESERWGGAYIPSPSPYYSSQTSIGSERRGTYNPSPSVYYPSQTRIVSEKGGTYTTNPSPYPSHGEASVGSGRRGNYTPSPSPYYPSQARVGSERRGTYNPSPSPYPSHPSREARIGSEGRERDSHTRTPSPYHPLSHFSHSSLETSHSTDAGTAARAPSSYASSHSSRPNLGRNADAVGSVHTPRAPSSSSQATHVSVSQHTSVGTRGRDGEGMEDAESNMGVGDYRTLHAPSQATHAGLSQHSSMGMKGRESDMAEVEGDTECDIERGLDNKTFGKIPPHGANSVVSKCTQLRSSGTETPSVMQRGAAKEDGEEERKVVEEGGEEERKKEEREGEEDAAEFTSDVGPQLRQLLEIGGNRAKKAEAEEEEGEDQTEHALDALFFSAAREVQHTSSDAVVGGPALLLSRTETLTDAQGEGEEGHALSALISPQAHTNSDVVAGEHRVSPAHMKMQSDAQGEGEGGHATSVHTKGRLNAEEEPPPSSHAEGRLDAQGVHALSAHTGTGLTAHHGPHTLVSHTESPSQIRGAHTLPSHTVRSQPHTLGEQQHPPPPPPPPYSLSHHHYMSAETLAVERGVLIDDPVYITAALPSASSSLPSSLVPAGIVACEAHAALVSHSMQVTTVEEESVGGGGGTAGKVSEGEVKGALSSSSFSSLPTSLAPDRAQRASESHGVEIRTEEDGGSGGRTAGTVTEGESGGKRDPSSSSSLPASLAPEGAQLASGSHGVEVRTEEEEGGGGGGGTAGTASKGEVEVAQPPIVLESKAASPDPPGPCFLLNHLSRKDLVCPF